MEWINLIATAITLLFGGGVLWIFQVKSKKLESQYQAKQAGETAESMELENQQTIIKMYKSALDDFKSIYDTEKKALVELNKALQIRSEILDKRVAELTNEIKSIKKRCLSYEEELKILKQSVNTECSSCDYSNGCKKYESSILNK